MVRMTDSSVLLSLGTEELMFLLRCLGLTSLPGLGEDAAVGPEGERLKGSLASAFNSLRAEGWVRWAPEEHEGRVVVDSTLAALLLTCATAPMVLYVCRVPVDGLPDGCYVHFGSHLSVIRRLPAAGVHAIVGTVSRDDVWHDTSALLHLDGQPVQCADPIVIDQQTLDCFSAAIRAEGADAGALMLSRAGVSADAASALALGMAHLRASSLITLIRLDGTGARQSTEGFVLVETDQGLWTLDTQPAAERSALVTLRSVSASDCRTRVESLWQSPLPSH